MVRAVIFLGLTEIFQGPKIAGALAVLLALGPAGLV